ncbi:MAG: 16S rRNA (cytosine(967)-C(5))-methyltransferase RsmB [Clostridia bacterium]
MIQPRELALQILYDIEKHQAYLNISFQNHIDRAALTGRDAALAKELVYGTIQRRLTLDDTLSRLSSVKLRKLAPYVLCILRMGLYQLFYMDKIPASAAVNESVRLAGKYVQRSRGFINAVLRRAAAEGLRLPEGDGDEALAVRYSHPAALVHWLRHRFGDEQALHILEENNQTPPLSVRVNTLKSSRSALLDRLRAEGAQVREGSMTDAAIIFDGGGVRQLAAYREGLFTIQDQSAQLAALALAPEPGQLVFDVCAAPGGKTTHLAELMENKGSILALDLYEKRLLSVRDAAKRLGLSIITTQTADARQLQPPAAADKILVDAPCSGLGVIRRRPDIKYKEHLTAFDELIQTQTDILRRCAAALKPGGELVYSTCTINPGENEELIHAFLSEQPGFSLQPVTSPHITGTAAVLKTGMGTFYPDRQGGDGFFIAKLKKE